MNNATPNLATLDEGRKHARTHLFVAATLYSDGASVPVRIRNMSTTGALIEAAVIPERDTAVILKRGSLQITGRIAWKTDRKAGVAFSTSVYVAGWMSRKVGSHQERVDEIVSDFNADRELRNSAKDVSASPSSSSIETELLALREELAGLGSSLIADAVLVAAHPEIQLLDISVQRVDRLISQLR